MKISTAFQPKTSFSNSRREIFVSYFPAIREAEVGGGGRGGGGRGWGGGWGWGGDPHY